MPKILNSFWRLLILFALLLGNSICCAIEKDRYSAEWVLVCQYDHYEDTDPSSNYVQAVYIEIDVLKGPPFSRRVLPIRYEIVRNSKTGKVDESLLPKKDTKCVLFCSSCVPYKRAGTFDFQTFNEVEGRREYSRQEVNEVLDSVEQATNLHFDALLRQKLFSKVEHFKNGVYDGIVPIIDAAEGTTPLPRQIIKGN